MRGVERLRVARSVEPEITTHTPHHSGSTISSKEGFEIHYHNMEGYTECQAVEIAQ
jgi:hypothetical protein